MFFFCPFDKLDPTLSQEEEILLEKYALLKERIKLLQDAENKDKLSPLKSNEVTLNTESIEDAKETAKKLVKSGAIDLKLNVRENQGFKRSHNLKRKLSDAHTGSHIKLESSNALNILSSKKLVIDGYKIPTSLNEDKQKEKDFCLQLLNSNNSTDKKDFINSLNLKEPIKNPSSYIPKRKNIFPPNNTIYISCRRGKLNIEILNLFQKYGKILKQNYHVENNRAFITLESIQIAETAIKEMNGSVAGDDVQLIVSYARHNNTPVNQHHHTAITIGDKRGPGCGNDGARLKRTSYDLDRCEDDSNTGHENELPNIIPANQTSIGDEGSTTSISSKGKKYANLWTFVAEKVDLKDKVIVAAATTTNTVTSADAPISRDPLPPPSSPSHVVTLFGETDQAGEESRDRVSALTLATKFIPKPVLGATPSHRTLVTYAEEDLFDSD